MNSNKLYAFWKISIRCSVFKSEMLMPAYKYLGIVLYFAGYKNHIGFYPTASGIEAFKNELSKYKGAKGSVQFPLDKPLPLALISKIVKFKLKENIRKAESNTESKSMKKKTSLNNIKKI